MPSAFHRIVLALTALAVVAPASTVLGQSVQCTAARPKARSDGWIEISVPESSIGEHAVKDFVALPWAPTIGKVLLATNGRTVQRTVDNGCAWDEVYVPTTQVGENPLPGPEIVVDAIEVAPSLRAAALIYLLVHDDTRAYVVTSRDMGATWQSASVGLPPQATGGALKVTPNPLVAYALINAANLADGLPLGESGPVTAGRLYVTRDGGDTWQPVNTEVAPEKLDHLALDAADPRALYAWNATSLFASADSGATFRKVTQVQPPISTIDVYRYPPVEPARVLAFRADQRAAYQSKDGATTWTTVPMPGIVRSAAHAPFQDTYAIASDRGVHVLGAGVPGGKPLDISPGGVAPVNLQFNHQSPVTLYGQAAVKIYARQFTPTYVPPPKPKLRKLPPVNLEGGVIADIDASSLMPPTATIPLLPGQSRTVRYQLDLSPTPTPMDIFFATDSTGSMDDTIAGLRMSFQDIINELGASGIDVRFGIADFRDYPVPGFGSPEDYPYRMLRGIGPIDEELKDAIESIEDGGGFRLDSQLAAAYQAATGEGQEKAPGSDSGGTAGRWIEPTKPGWRTESLRVIVLAADVRANDPETDPGYPGPSYATVIKALNRKKIELVGLAVGGGGSGSGVEGGPFESLSRVAKGTKTLAPEGGTDCDGDGAVDIDAGDPMVCRIGGSDADGVAPALIGMLKSVTDLNTVGLQITGDERVVQHASAPAYDDINVKASNRLFFDVTYTCGAETAGETYPVTLRGRSGEVVVAQAAASVICILPEGPRTVYVPPAAAGLVLPPPPPPAPIPQVNPNMNPNPNPNPNPQFQPAPQGQPGYGLAAEEQEQLHVALAYDELAPADVEYAMTGLGGETDYVPALLFAGVLMTGVAGAVATRSRGVPKIVFSTIRK